MQLGVKLTSCRGLGSPQTRTLPLKATGPTHIPGAGGLLVHPEGGFGRMDQRACRKVSPSKP